MDLYASLSYSFHPHLCFDHIHSHDVHSNIDSSNWSSLRDDFHDPCWPLLKIESFLDHICCYFQSPYKFSSCCFLWIDKTYHFHLKLSYWDTYENGYRVSFKKISNFWDCLNLKLFNHDYQCSQVFSISPVMNFANFSSVWVFIEPRLLSQKLLLWRSMICLNTCFLFLEYRNLFHALFLRSLESFRQSVIL